MAETKDFLTHDSLDKNKIYLDEFYRLYAPIGKNLKFGSLINNAFTKVMLKTRFQMPIMATMLLRISRPIPVHIGTRFPLFIRFISTPSGFSSSFCG